MNYLKLEKLLKPYGAVDTVHEDFVVFIIPAEIDVTEVLKEYEFRVIPMLAFKKVIIFKERV